MTEFWESSFRGSLENSGGRKGELEKGRETKNEKRKTKKFGCYIPRSVKIKINYINT
jgi:hypothetical protein